jgi:SAM-dependent methyltransferase
MRSDRWQDAAAYDRFMGRWSRSLAAAFVRWLDAPPEAHWLEIGCGTGSLTSAIFELGSPGSVTACDTAADYVGYCAASLRYPNLEAVIASTDALPSRVPGYDVVASSLVLNFLPDPVAALAAMREACSPGGHVAACVWDYSEGMEFLRHFWDAAVTLDPGAAPYHEGARFPLCRKDALRAAFLEAGFDPVAIEALTIATPFSGFDDFWIPFVTGPGPAPTYTCSLPDTARERLADLLRSRLIPHGDRPFVLQARAWAAKGANPDTKGA